MPPQAQTPQAGPSRPPPVQPEYRPANSYAGGPGGYQGSRDVPPRDSAPPMMQQQPSYQSYRGHYDAGPVPQNSNEEFASLPPRPNQRPYQDNNVVYGGTRPATNSNTYDEYTPRAQHHHQQQQQYSQQQQHQQQHSGYY